jgi:hypothetical protein
MKRTEEWDWPPTQRRKYYRSPRYYRSIDVYQPSGWSSPVVKKIINVYWRVMVTSIKVLISIPLSIIAISAFWLLWVLITLQFASPR